MKKSYHLKTSTLYFLTAENPKELFGKLYPRRIEATEYKLMEHLPNFFIIEHKYLLN